MLQAILNISDLAASSPTVEGPAVSIGGSHIHPFLHANLESILVRGAGQWFFVARERLRDDDQARSSIKVLSQVPPDRFHQLYQECVDWPLDFILVEVACIGGRLRVRAGQLGSLPVYFCVSERSRSVVLSWDFADFLHESRSPDVEVLAHHLTMKASYSVRQPCIGVNLLTAGAKLYVDANDTQFEYGPREPSRSSRGLMENVDATEEFGRILRDVIFLRPPGVGGSAVELSGGMDSACVAMALADDPGSITCGGILVDDESSPAQRARRSQVLSILNCRDISIDMQDHLPRMNLDLDPEHPLPLPSEYYLEAFEALWNAFRADGCETVWSGIGGDELCVCYAGEDEEAAFPLLQCFDAAIEQAEGLLTRRGLEAARSSFLFVAPAGAVPSTTLLANLCQARPLASRGLWPVNPLGDPRLVRFSAELPLEYRSNKQILRQYLHLRTNLKLFPQNYEKETFELILPAAIANQSAGLASQLQSCALADFGLVSHRAVIALLHQVAATREFSATSALASFLWAERFARQLC
ncbi:MULTISPECIES: hypothetical protein [unclassified Bradyrhizobium]|uniref:hypothetical protein n=1 Tax=unclassified Bradyrhizobium TaxID=2631580 RepID=UPI002916988F|nr:MULTISPECIES: hypothetical protein [unclassified Bradyrhizobium]